MGGARRVVQGPDTTGLSAPAANQRSVVAALSLGSTPPQARGGP